MPKLTIAADEDVLCWVRTKAAQTRTSVDRFIGDLLREQMSSTRAYAVARRRHFELIRPKRFVGKPPKRDKLHDRDGLR